jgi:hypothetical protein
MRKYPISHCKGCARSNPVLKIPINNHSKEDLLVRHSRDFPTRCGGKGERSERNAGNPRHDMNPHGLRLATLGLAMAWAMWPEAAHAGLREILAAKLAEYCIPKDEAGCVEPYKASLNGTQCVCPSGGRYYNGINRRCEACSAGTYALPDTAVCLECPAPTAASCPFGTYLASIADVCPSGHYAVEAADCDAATGTGGGPGSCPSGTYAMSF